MNVVNAAATVATVVRLHPVAAVVVAIANALVALAGVAVTGMVGTKEMVEMNAGGEAGHPLRGIAGGACLLIGGGMIGREPLPWTMASN
jgi:hypothetical protein